MTTKIQNFIKEIVSRNNTFAEVIALVKTSKEFEIKNLTIKDIVSYEGEILIDLISNDDDDAEDLNELLEHYIGSYQNYQVTRLDDTYYKNKKITIINLISYYYKYHKSKELEKSQLEKNLNSKTVEQHLNEFALKLQMCKSEKDLIILLKQANITPNELSSYFESNNCSHIDFLNLGNKKNKTSQEKELIKNQLEIFITKSNWDIEFNDYDEEKQIAIFKYKPLNITIGAIGVTDSYDRFESDNFIEVKFSEKIIMVWQPK